MIHSKVYILFSDKVTVLKTQLFQTHVHKRSACFKNKGLKLKMYRRSTLLKLPNLLKVA